MHRRQIRPRKIDEFKRMPILRDEITANDGVDRFFQYDDDSGAPQRVSRSELEVRARPPPPPSRARQTAPTPAPTHPHVHTCTSTLVPPLYAPFVPAHA